MLTFLIILELVLIWPAISILNRWLKKRNLVNSGLIALFAILFIFLLIPIGYYQFEIKYANPKIRSTQFNSNIWKTEESERYTMVNDLLNNGLLLGKAKSEIITLLGTDYEIGPCNNCIGYSTFDPDIGFSIDHDVLAVYFDTLGNAIEIRKDMW